MVALVASALRALAVADGSPGGGIDNTGLGYLMAPSLSPVHTLRPSPIFAGTARQPQGSWEVGFDAQWANIWDYDADRYLIDGEWYRVNTRVAYSVRADLSVGLDVPFCARSSGFADSGIEDFHDVFGMSNSDRRSFPSNRTLIQMTDDEGTRTVVLGDSWGIGDAIGFVIWQASQGDALWPAVAIHGQVTVPTGDDQELEGLGEPSAALGVVLSKRLWSSDFLVHSGLGYFYSPADELGGIRLQHEEYSGLVGFEYQCSERLSLVAQELTSSAAVEDCAGLSRSCYELSVGLRWRVGTRTTFEASVGENVGVFDNSADVALHVLMARTL